MADMEIDLLPSKQHPQTPGNSSLSPRSKQVAPILGTASDSDTPLWEKSYGPTASYSRQVRKFASNSRLRGQHPHQAQRAPIGLAAPVKQDTPVGPDQNRPATTALPPSFKDRFGSLRRSEFRALKRAAKNDSSDASNAAHSLRKPQEVVSPTQLRQLEEWKRMAIDKPICKD